MFSTNLLPPNVHRPVLSTTRILRTPKIRPIPTVLMSKTMLSAWVIKIWELHGTCTPSHRTAELLCTSCLNPRSPMTITTLPAELRLIMLQLMGTWKGEFSVICTPIQTTQLLLCTNCTSPRDSILEQKRSTSLQIYNSRSPFFALCGCLTLMSQPSCLNLFMFSLISFLKKTCYSLVT